MQKGPFYRVGLGFVPVANRSPHPERLCGVRLDVTRNGPAAMKPVGEVEFVNGTAAMTASGQHGKSRLCAGIVGHADLCSATTWHARWGRRSLPATARFRGIRQSVVWDASEMFSRGRANSPKGRMDSMPSIHRRYLEIAPRHCPGRSWCGAPVALRREGAGPRHLHRGRADDVRRMRWGAGTACRHQQGIQLLLRQLRL
jgi:hypothetical protein